MRNFSTSSKSLTLLKFIFVIYLFERINCAQIISTYSTPAFLTKFAVDKSTKIVYLGASNTIYKLSAGLESIDEISIGPYDDHYECKPSPALCSHERRSSNSFPTVLYIDGIYNHLIVCSGLKQGACERRSLSDIHQVATTVHVSLTSETSDLNKCILFIYIYLKLPIAKILHIYVRRPDKISLMSAFFISR